MRTTRTSSKGQMVIPKSIRDSLNIREGTELSVQLTGGDAFTVTVKRADRDQALARLVGMLAHRAKPMSGKEEAAAIGARLAADDERIKREYRRR